MKPRSYPSSRFWWPFIGDSSRPVKMKMARRLRLLLSLQGPGSGPLEAILVVLGWGIMRHMGIVELGMVVLFLVAVALAAWWVATRLRG